MRAAAPPTHWPGSVEVIIKRQRVLISFLDAEIVLQSSWYPNSHVD
jgi:hypothetical protein